MPNNSSSRVHDILVKAKQSGASTPTVTVWSRVFDLRNASKIEVAPFLIDLFKELEMIEDEAKGRFPEATAKVKLKHFPAIKEAVAFKDIDHGFAQVAALLSDAALDSLESLAHDLSEEPVIQQSDMETIWAACDDLFKMVEESDLKPMLKKFVLDWISKIRRALERYRITGVKGLRQALIEIRGEAFFLEPVVEQVKKDSSTLYSKIQSWLAGIVTVVDFAEKIRKICESPFVAPLIDHVLQNAGIESHQGEVK